MIPSVVTNGSTFWSVLNILPSGNLICSLQGVETHLLRARIGLPVTVLEVVGLGVAERVVLNESMIW